MSWLLEWKTEKLQFSSISLDHLLNFGQYKCDQSFLIQRLRVLDKSE